MAPVTPIMHGENCSGSSDMGSKPQNYSSFHHFWILRKHWNVGHRIWLLQQLPEGPDNSISAVVEYISWLCYTPQNLTSLNKSSLPTWLHFTITYALKFIYVNCNCMVEILRHAVLLSLSSQLCIHWCHVGSWKPAGALHHGIWQCYHRSEPLPSLPFRLQSCCLTFKSIPLTISK